MKLVSKKTALGFVAAVVIASCFAGSPVRADTSPKIGSGSRACVLTPGADCDGVALKRKLTFHGDASGVSFVRAWLNGANLSGANLAKADLRGARLKRANLHNANLKSADLGPAPKSSKTTLRSVSRATPACAATFSCSGADLSYADLSNANLIGALMYGTNFSHANLTGADLGLGTLFGANLSYANLTNTNLSGATLDNANLYGATSTGTNFSGAHYSSTTCPNGELIGVPWSTSTHC